MINSTTLYSEMTTHSLLSLAQIITQGVAGGWGFSGDATSALATSLFRRGSGPIASTGNIVHGRALRCRPAADIKEVHRFGM